MMRDGLKTGKLKSKFKETASCSLGNSTNLPPTLDPANNIEEENKSGPTSRKKRRYVEDYLNFGFTWIGNKNEPNEFCVLNQEYDTNYPCYYENEDHLDGLLDDVPVVPWYVVPARLQHKNSLQQQLMDRTEGR
ncbi:hypothetical protein FQA39_LY03882 [Lamprigera yunnana]|nr:hypothetical protein FQA39_LY03882 [Lamprigera yunnana]